MQDKNNIGLKKSWNVEHYKDEWVILHTRSSGGIAGYAMDVDTNNVLLMPYQMVDYDDKGVPYQRIEETGKPFKVPKDEIGPIRTTSRESIENNCKYMNRKLQNEAMQDERHRRELTDHFENLDSQRKDRNQLSILYKGSKDQ